MYAFALGKLEVKWHYEKKQIKTLTAEKLIMEKNLERVVYAKISLLQTLR